MITATDQEMVTRELNELKRKIEVTQELFTDNVTNGAIDIPVFVMLDLMDAHTAVESAIKSHENYLGSIPR